jgi:hypothetical protein
MRAGFFLSFDTAAIGLAYRTQTLDFNGVNTLRNHYSHAVLMRY